MGICDGFECEIPGSTPPRIDVPKDAVTLSKMSYGYSVELSPMQIIAFYNAIANDGRMVRPMLVRNIERDGEIIKAWETETIKGSICSQSALRDVKAALHDVVWDNNLGTAAVLRWNGKIVRRKAQSDLVSIAGKTGTAQILENGRYQRYKHRITFVGYFPEENPEYTCLCMINHPANYPAYDAGGDCGTVVRQIAEKTMAYVGEYRWTDGQWVWTKRR
jgi:cell division protein FtsI (penicillin-binding protein 3)